MIWIYDTDYSGLIKCADFIMSFMVVKSWNKLQIQNDYELIYATIYEKW